MLVASVSMAERAKPSTKRRSSMSERSALSYHRLQMYDKDLEKTIQRLEQDALHNILTQKIVVRKLTNELAQKHVTIAKTRSCDTPPSVRSVDESETQEYSKASVNSRQAGGTRGMLRSGSVGTLQLAAASPGKAYEGGNAEQAKCQQQQRPSTGRPHSRSGSLGDQASLIVHRRVTNRRTSMPAVPAYFPSGQRKNVTIRRLASDEFLVRRSNATNAEVQQPIGISPTSSSRRIPTISLAKDPDAVVDEESETLDLSPMVPPRVVRCIAWESKSNTSLLVPPQALPLSGSPRLTQHSLLSSSSHSISSTHSISSSHSVSSSSPVLPHLPYIGSARDDESSTLTAPLLSIKTSSKESSFTRPNGKRPSLDPPSLSSLKASQTTNKEQLLEAARIMNFGPEASKSSNPTMFKKFYSHIPAGRTTCERNRDVSLCG